MLLNDMVNKGLKLTVILNSCHSGSILRKSDYKFRGIPWNVEVDGHWKKMQQMQKRTIPPGWVPGNNSGPPHELQPKRVLHEMGETGTNGMTELPSSR